MLREMLDQGSIQRLILNPENRGVAFAANQGWTTGEKAYYMKVDNDIVFSRAGWLSHIVKVCDGLEDAGAVAFNFETRSYPLRDINGFRVRPKEGNLGGCCILIPERVHRHLGFWCEEYFPYGEEDIDMYVRMSLLKLKMYYMEDENIGLHLPEGKASPLLKGSFDSLYTEQDPAYRALKDTYRKKHAGEKGLFKINEKLYRKGLRPLYIHHGTSYRPSWRALLYVWWRYGLLNPWKNQRAATPATSPLSGKPG
jgi:hypothetical protein